MKAKNKAILYVLCSALGFAFMNLFVKLAGNLPFLQKCFFRNFVAMFFAAGILCKQKITLKQPKEGLKYVLLRSIFGGTGMLCNFYAIDHLVIADASMLNKLSPFFAIIFSIFFLKEKPKVYQMLCVITAFSGALFILKPGVSGLLSFPAFIGMLGGAGAGIAYANVRLATSKGVDKPFIVFFFSAFTSLLCLPGMLLSFQPMTAFQWFCMLMTGACATVGQMGITSAYALAKASEISVYDYSMIIFAAILGMIFLGEVPDLFSFIGYFIIIGAGITMFLLNNRKSTKTS